jgi:flagellar biosynthesis protein FliQ
VIGSLYFAAKKTNSKMSITLSSLYGAATMNSTFCLAIFYALVYFQGLTWDFTAEVIAIAVVVLIVGKFASISL